MNENEINVYIDRAMRDAIKLAHTAGYEKGLTHGYNKAHKEFEIKLNNLNRGSCRVYDRLEYKDLALPSGLLIAFDYLRIDDGVEFMPYDEASRLDIPTVEQWREIEQCCKINVNESSFHDVESIDIIGRNGEYITLGGYGFECGSKEAREGELLIWLRDDTQIGNVNMPCVHISHDSGAKSFVSSHFSGDQLPILLVKTK